ncbi:MAG: 16S rRNA processing protein RimM [Clostridia bacterium]|nr:16S rRNA processing protein RimM [Clostridia bacterium]
MAKSSYIECAKVINTHGCHGGLKLESWCNTPEELAALKKLYLKNGSSYSENKVLKASVYKQFVVVTLDTVNSMDDALALKGATVYADRGDFELEEGEFFITDLRGLNVIDANDGKIYGTLSEVINRGASDIYVVNTSNGERMIPVVPEFVDHVDIESGIFVTPIDGMLDD